jgi:hypothetical protein
MIIFLTRPPHAPGRAFFHGQGRRESGNRGVPAGVRRRETDD